MNSQHSPERILLNEVPSAFLEIGNLHTLLKQNRWLHSDGCYHTKTDQRLVLTFKESVFANLQSIEQSGVEHQHAYLTTGFCADEIVITPDGSLTFVANVSDSASFHIIEVMPDEIATMELELE